MVELYSLKVVLHKVFITYKGKWLIFTAEKLGRQHLRQLIQEDNVINRPNKNPVLPDRDQWEDHSITWAIFLSKIDNLKLIIRNKSNKLVLEVFWTITSLYSERVMRVKERWKTCCRLKKTCNSMLSITLQNPGKIWMVSEH